MTAHLRYLSYLLRHKWFVLVAGLRMIWRGAAGPAFAYQLLVHDWTKFLPREWFPYVHRFYGPKRGEAGGKCAAEAHHAGGHFQRYDDDDPDYMAAWNSHQKANPHHWQFWLLTWDLGPRGRRPPDGTKTVALPMPRRFVLEMVADWRGAGRAQGAPDTGAWYRKHADDMTLHVATRAAVVGLLFNAATEGA